MRFINQYIIIFELHYRKMVEILKLCEDADLIFVFSNKCDDLHMTMAFKENFKKFTNKHNSTFFILVYPILEWYLYLEVIKKIK